MSKIQKLFEMKKRLDHLNRIRSQGCNRSEYRKKYNDQKQEILKLIATMETRNVKRSKN